MSVYPRYLTGLLVTLSMISGLLSNTIIGHISPNDASFIELRWALLLGMPIVLILNHLWLGGENTPRKVLNNILFSVGQIITFIGPLFWLYGR